MRDMVQGLISCYSKHQLASPANFRRFRPSFFTFEVALESSRKALSSHTNFGGCRWLEQKHEVAIFVRVFRCSGFNQISRACFVVIVAQNQGTDLELEIQLGIRREINEESASSFGYHIAMSTTYHPQTDGQSERTIQTLEDMLRAVVMDFEGSWQDALSLVEFSYNNSYQVMIGMASFEALYGRKCRSPVCWEEVGEKQLSAPDFVQHMKDHVDLIRQRMKAARIAKPVMRIRGVDL
ncbi:hypothetical protein F511_27833 [Dorcoceras hygrometricum]|uniref:Integrase catalytic domain-containing protein n=1 Tax=Dorcoceras hygrometricum TaxID=472368 RepID=A0A2Z7C6D2_9LAMI|nr:hypothetical protein F511_27833 [Dorcoceras hygrometricum]